MENTCKYCSHNADLFHTDGLDDFDLEFHIHGQSLMYDSCNDDIPPTYQISSRFKINYCPMCGRSLVHSNAFVDDITRELFD